jgi:hypothetical protein
MFSSNADDPVLCRRIAPRLPLQVSVHPESAFMAVERKVQIGVGHGCSLQAFAQFDEFSVFGCCALSLSAKRLIAFEIFRCPDRKLALVIVPSMISS